MANRIGCTLVVLGEDWLAGEEEQHLVWAKLRREFDKSVTARNLALVEEPRERTDYDEERGEVRISIHSMAVEAT